MQTSSALTVNEIDTLNLIVPGYFSVAAETNRVLLTLYAPNSNKRLPLVTYEILPASKPDFEGTLLADLIEDLSATLVTGLQALQEKRERLALNDIMQLINNAAISTSQRRISSREYQILTEKIHSVSPADWMI